MRELTFKGFLAQYVRDLSEAGTNSLYKLAREADKTNARLVEPLFLYALTSGKQEVLLRAVRGNRLYDHYCTMLETCTAETLTETFQKGTAQLEEGYVKVWKSYLRCKNRGQGEEHTKELMRQKVLRIQEKKGISNYRIYTDLKLNPGNFNAWLKHGCGNKVSLETARKALHYVETYGNK